MAELSTEALAVISKVEKLLALAGNNDNEHQAAAASAKAMELLAAYNLDMAVIGQGKGASRSDTNLKGGLYQWQRDLWESAARLNFCVYRSIRGLAKGSSYEHKIIGAHVNVVSTRIMAEYLQQTIERLTREWAEDQGFHSVFVKAAIAYREGMAERLSHRLWDLRQQRIRADEQKRREAEAATRHPSAAPGTALVLADVIQTEDDLNTDYLHGLEPGTTGRERAEWKARQAAALAAYEEEIRKQQEWETAHPAEAAAKRAEQKRLDAELKIKENKRCEKNRKREERNAKRRKGTYYDRAETPREQRRSMEAFKRGFARGSDVGLDPQVDDGSKRRIG